MAGLFGHQREQQQLEIVGAELAAARHAVVAEIAEAAPATAAERAAAECIVAATVATDRVPETGESLGVVMRTMTVASGMAAEVIVSHDRVLYVVKHI
ncbi:hypothetical protein OH687_20250 [Burkholderia anthina]|nr:hypothetical protein OH687_20250 [Burkholderia anthina]